MGCTVFQDPWCQGWSAGSLGPRGGTAAPSFSSRAEAVDEAGASLRWRRPGREQAQMGLRGGSEAWPGRAPALTRPALPGSRLCGTVSGSSRALWGCGSKYTAGSLVESPGVVCSPSSEEEGTFSGPGGHCPLCWPQWTRSRCADSGGSSPLLTHPVERPSQPITHSSALSWKASRVPEAPLNLGCSRRSAVSSGAVRRAGTRRIKRALSGAVFGLFVHTQGSMRPLKPSL